MSTLTPDDLLEAYTRVSVLNKDAIDQFAVIAEQFHRRGIDCVVLKGADLVSRLYGAQGLRPMADVDLLVHERDLPAIDAILRRMGYRQEIDGNPAYGSPGHCLIVDLVTSIWYLDTPDALQGVWQRAVPRSVGGQAVKGMSSEDLLLYLTAYAVIHRAVLSAKFARDVALLVKKEPLNWAFIVDEVTRCSLRVPLYHGLSFARSREGIMAIPDTVLARLAPSSQGEKVMAWVIRKLVTETFVYGIGHFLLFITRPGLRKWQWLRGSLFPTRAFLAYRYGTRGLTSPLWTRLTRAAYLVARAQVLLFRMLCLLVKRTTPASP